MGLLFLAAAGLQSTLDFNHDVAWILMTAQWVLDGGEIGRDIIDLNPPLVWWLSTVPVAVARALEISLAGASILTTLALCLCSIALSRFALRGARMSTRSQDIFLIFAAAILLLAPGYDFGQREHHFLIAALPYLVASSRAAEGEPVSRGRGVAIGLFCAIGFCLKPYFLLLPAMAELLVLVRTRRIFSTIRPESLAIPTVAFGYVAAVMIWAPAYLNEALPDAAGSYWAYNSPASEVAMRLLLALLPIGIAAVLIGRRNLLGRGLPQFLLVGAAAAAVVASYQMKGWPYHLLPAVALGCLAGGAACFAIRERCQWSVRTTGALAIIAVAAWAKPAIALLNTVAAPGPDASEQLTQLFRSEVEPDGSVYAFTTSGRDLTPALLETGIDWAAPVGGPYLLPAAVRQDGPQQNRARLQEAAERQLALILHSLRQRGPTLILFDDRGWKLAFGGYPFSYVDYLQRYSGYRALMAGYTERERVGGFRIFVRIDAARR